MLDYLVFDADNHYYEAEDAFSRYASERMVRERFVRWLTEADGKRRRLIVGTRDVNVISNPTFNPVGKPGIYHETLKNIELGLERTSRDSFGELFPIDPAYRDRAARIKTMDAQGVERIFMFPTLGVTVEGLINQDAELMYDAFHAFNRWIDDDWGFNRDGRIYAAPYMVMMDLDRLVAELEYVLEHGAKVITIRPGPAYGRSPGDPYFDPFWARVNEAELVVAYHALDGPSTYTEAFRKNWAAAPATFTKESLVLQRIAVGDNAIMDTLLALVLHNVFGRFPKIRVACIELGVKWVPYLKQRLDHAGGLIDRRINAFGQDLPGRPSDIFRQHVWVSPFPEEDILALAEQIGPEHVLFGSDWPHLEGMSQPVEYADYLKDLEPDLIRRIMRDNAVDLVNA